MRILHKLFLAIATTSIVLVSLLALVSRYNLDSGFRAYLVELEKHRLPELAEPLLAHYQREGSWQRLVGRPREFHRVIYRDLHGAPAGPAGEPARRPGGERPPPGRSERPPPPEHRRGGDRHPADQVQRLGLLAPDRRALVGNPGPEHFLYPLRLDGELVGWLSLAPAPVSAPADAAFLERQQRGLLVVAAALLLVGLLVSWLLSRQLVQPIQAVARGMAELGHGKYGATLEAGGKGELAQLAGSFNQLSRSLQRHEESRRNWTADIAHELRTPVAVLRGEIEALRDGVRPLNAAAVESLLEECARLQRLVEDLHTLSMADSGSLSYQFRSMNVLDLLEQVLESGRARLDAAGLVVEVRTVQQQVPVYGDPDRLAQLFYNLLENSCRYTDAPGRLAISLEVANGQVLLNWEDSAPCPPVADLDKLFGRFYRPEKSRSRELGGSGLGLAICQRIVEAHGGKLSATPGSLGGLGIRLTLPLTDS